MSEVKQYAQRDIMELDEAGNHYIRHVDHMTREKLHSKSDIAAELGWRDMQIAELKAQRNALAAENAVMLEVLTDISEQYQEVQTESEENAAVIDLDYISEVNTYVSRDVDGENPFTATDTYLNSVRADAVQELADAWYAIANETSDGVWISDSTRLKYLERADDAADFAAQLRAGEPS